MKKNLFYRCLFGAPTGLAISYAITIIISLFIGDGRFHAVVPELTALCGSEINAVLLQSVCSLIYGAIWAGSSVVWEKENWSLLRQTITHLIIGSTATFPIAYLLRCMEHSLLGISLYFALFFAIYFVIWFSLYSVTKRRIRQLNARVRENNRPKAGV